MCFRAVQQKRQGDNHWKRIEWSIALHAPADEKSFLSCTPFIGMQVGIFHNRLKPVIEFSPSYPEEPCEFTLRHGYLSMSFSDNLHIAAPSKVTAMIGSVCYGFYVIACFHAVSSILQIGFTGLSLRSFLSLYRLLGDEPVHILRNFLVCHLCINLRA